LVEVIREVTKAHSVITLCRPALFHLLAKPTQLVLID
jgi:hypothetical protein